MVGPAVDPVHHDGQVLAQLVGQSPTRAPWRPSWI
jgi:hypothetical protein